MIDFQEDFWDKPKDYDLEKEVLTKEKSDKRELITQLVKAANPNEQTKKLLLLIMKGHTVNRAATQVGMCHKTARRRLEKLQSHFDEDFFGDLFLYVS